MSLPEKNSVEVPESSDGTTSHSEKQNVVNYKTTFEKLNYLCLLEYLCEPCLSDKSHEILSALRKAIYKHLAKFCEASYRVTVCESWGIDSALPASKIFRSLLNGSSFSFCMWWHGLDTERSNRMGSTTEPCVSILSIFSPTNGCTVIRLTKLLDEAKTLSAEDKKKALKCLEILANYLFDWTVFKVNVNIVTDDVPKLQRSLKSMYNALDPGSTRQEICITNAVELQNLADMKEGKKASLKLQAFRELGIDYMGFSDLLSKSDKFGKQGQEWEGEKLHPFQLLYCLLDTASPCLLAYKYKMEFPNQVIDELEITVLEQGSAPGIPHENVVITSRCFVASWEIEFY